MHATLMEPRNSNTSGWNFVQGRRKKSCSCLWNKPPQGISVETKLSLNNNKIKIWWWWLDAKSCNTPAIGSASQALAPRSKLRDLEASDLESRKTTPRPLVYCATLKGWTFRLSANFPSTSNSWFGKDKIPPLATASMFYSGTQEIFNHPYSSKYQLLFFHSYLLPHFIRILVTTHARAPRSTCKNKFFLLLINCNSIPRPSVTLVKSLNWFEIPQLNIHNLFQVKSNWELSVAAGLDLLVSKCWRKLKLSKLYNDRFPILQRM